MDFQNKCRSLFLIDDTRDYTNNYYIFELVKIVLFREGFFAMSLPQIRERIESITDMQYTEGEILYAIAQMNNGTVVIKDENYSLSSMGEALMKSRQKDASLDPFVKLYLESLEDSTIDLNSAIQLIYRFVFERFNENLAQISDIFNQKIDFDLPKEKYSIEQNSFINGFLAWGNVEKNRLVYRLISKAFDYCMINGKCERSILDFSQYKFYLDTNIIFRLMGFNNEDRKDSVSSFVEKSRSVGVQLCVSGFVLDECQITIDRQLDLLIAKTSNLQSLISPSSMSFAEENSIYSGFYQLYYDWCHDGNKHRNYEGFRKYINKNYKKVVEMFSVDQEHISFKVTEPLYDKLFDSLYQIKNDKHTTDTDINSILFVKELREKAPDIYFISSDKQLISWASDVFKTQKNLADYPSVWFSVFLKYTGREKENDYKSFCQFIHLPIPAESEDDLRKRIEIKKAIMASDFDDAIKDSMLQDIQHQYSVYKEFSTDEIVHRAYTQSERTIREQAKAEERRNANLLLKTKMEQIDSLHKEEMQRVQESFAEEKESAVSDAKQSGVEAGKSEVINALANKRIKRNNNIRIALGVSIIAFLVLAIVGLVMWFISTAKTDSQQIWGAISRIAGIISLVTFPCSLVAIAIKLIAGKKEWLSLNLEKNVEIIKKHIR